jgi:hypothetical protein
MWAEDYPVALTRAMPRDLSARVHGMTVQCKKIKIKKSTLHF